ncbi:adenine phosphoribosyltransferase [Bacteroidales bacterium OttesenSCG-928-B11]|nr:adenine phosphoribosyltransferase [Bacteroidales bacterium OttesenSCG-928-C03]MDL2311430.1 adenine phosphoribosyltransferase [Bacteroidales bacterium OttesenSCG-928-B11]
MVDSSKIRVVPDFPTEGIKFYDITTILNDPTEFQNVFQALLTEAKKMNPEVIIALEARGYFFAPAIALALNIPFVPVRKKGKLPFHTFQETYDLEYGQASIEIHNDAIRPHSRILLFDDVLATGGTAQAAIKLLNHFEPKDISALFYIELPALHGREKLTGVENIVSLITF